MQTFRKEHSWLLNLLGAAVAGAKVAEELEKKAKSPPVGKEPKDETNGTAEEPSGGFDREISIDNDEPECIARGQGRMLEQKPGETPQEFAARTLDEVDLANKVAGANGGWAVALDPFMIKTMGDVKPKDAKLGSLYIVTYTCSGICATGTCQNTVAKSGTNSCECK